MNSKFDNGEFEQFLKQNADQYRMYPSQKVWKGIYNSLHSRRRWFAFGLVLLVLSTATAIWILNYSTSINKQVAAVPEKNINTLLKQSEKAFTEILNPALLPFQKTNSFVPYMNNPLPEISLPGIADNPVSISEEMKEVVDAAMIPGDPASLVSDPVEESNKKATDDIPISINSNKEATETPISINIIDPETDNNSDLNDQNMKKLSTETVVNKPSLNDSYPLSIESVLNHYKAPTSKNLSIQAYFTPTISFRKLSQNNSFLNSTTNNNTSLGLTSAYDINQAVTHKPGLGLEFGISARYPIRKNIKIKAGLQANINRYDIKAFNYSGELTTIALNQGTGINSLHTWSKYRNFTGYAQSWLQNYYFSISVPVGAEVNITGNKKVSFGIAGSIQPTYIVHDRAYLITTDYKNYAEIPWLIRRLNVNTSMDLFVNYTSGKVKWQVGPQVRYQLLSSFQSKYPFKENLYNYGMKVGIMLKK